MLEPNATILSAPAYKKFPYHTSLHINEANVFSSATELKKKKIENLSGLQNATLIESRPVPSLQFLVSIKKEFPYAWGKHGDRHCFLGTFYMEDDCKQLNS